MRASKPRCSGRLSFGYGPPRVTHAACGRGRDVRLVAQLMDASSLLGEVVAPIARESSLARRARSQKTRKTRKTRKTSTKRTTRDGRRSMKLNRQIVGNVGLYYVCFRLSLLEWNVMPTSRNAQGIDVVAYRQRGTEFVGVQVKTLSERNSAIIGKSIENLQGEYWVIVTNAITDPEAFVLTPDEVRTLATRGGPKERTQYWVRVSDYDQDKFREAWDRIRPRRATKT